MSPKIIMQKQNKGDVLTPLIETRWVIMQPPKTHFLALSSDETKIMKITHSEAAITRLLEAVVDV